MCGICGIVHFDANNPVSPGVVAGMTERIAHRGPDDSGYFVDRGAALGHRRLSIIDLSGGKQPIFNEDESVVVVFNGEIYNYQEITTELIARGHVFRTRSDTEAIVHAYEEYGDDCVQKFRGMFAFSIWDRRRQRLLLVRDRLGIKPVYYYHGRDGLVFASEIKSLLAAPGVPREVDETALGLYLAQRYVPGPRTMFKDIFKLQPGHLMVVERGRAEIRQYWDIPYSAESERSDPEEFAHLLEESVRLRLIAEVPLGVFLSGGLDSSAILATMSAIRKGEGAGAQPIKSFCVGYESPGGVEDGNNEFAYAREVAKAFGADHHEFTLRADDFRDFIPKLVWHLDEPLADPSCVPLYFISKMAREQITVVLSGEGADELLGGYSIYSKMLALEEMRRIPGAGGVAKALATGFTGRYQDVLRMASLPLEQRYRGVSRGFRPALQARLTGKSCGTAALDAIYDPLFRAVSESPALDRMLYVDSKVWLPDDLLLKADRMTMATGLELRVPFLDHKIVEFAARLPEQCKLNGGAGKVLLRETMAGILPECILKRPKKGFPVPTMSWLRGPLKDFTRDTLLDRNSAIRNFFDPGVVQQIVDQHEKGADRQQEIWTLLVFENWHRAFCEHFRSASGATLN